MFAYAFAGEVREVHQRVSQCLLWLYNRATSHPDFDGEGIADLLMNPAKHGCRHDERNPKALTVPR